MDDKYRLLITMSCLVLMFGLLAGVFFMVIRYLISVSRLLRHIRTTEPELWTSLGRPPLFPLFHVSLNPFKGLAAQMSFLAWFLKGAPGAADAGTRELARKTTRLFKMSGIGLGIYFVACLAIFAFLILVLGPAANGAATQPALP